MLSQQQIEMAKRRLASEGIDVEQYGSQGSLFDFMDKGKSKKKTSSKPTYSDGAQGVFDFADPLGTQKKAAAPKPAPKSRQAAGPKKQRPKEGDVNAKGLVFKGGRWHRQDTLHKASGGGNIPKAPATPKAPKAPKVSAPKASTPPAAIPQPPKVPTKPPTPQPAAKQNASAPKQNVPAPKAQQKDSNHDATLDAAAPFRQYGKAYDRTIATRAARYEKARREGHSPQMLDHLHKELKTALDATKKQDAAATSDKEQKEQKGEAKQTRFADLPGFVQEHINAFMETGKSLKAKLDQGRATDKKFGGQGRYEAEVFERMKKDVDKHNAAVELFIDNAKLEGVDGEAILAELGGRPDISLTPRGQAYFDDLSESDQSPAEKAKEQREAVYREHFDRVLAGTTHITTRSQAEQVAKNYWSAYAPKAVKAEFIDVNDYAQRMGDHWDKTNPGKSSQTGKASRDDGPKDGDRNAEGLVFRNGRWHREDKKETASDKPKADAPNIGDGQMASGKRELANEDAEAGDQLGLIDGAGERRKGTKGKFEDNPNRQQNKLFSTDGDPNQGMMFDDGVTDKDLLLGQDGKMGSDDQQPGLTEKQAETALADLAKKDQKAKAVRQHRNSGSDSPEKSRDEGEKPVRQHRNSGSEASSPKSDDSPPKYKVPKDKKTREQIIDDYHMAHVKKGDKVIWSANGQEYEVAKVNKKTIGIEMQGRIEKLKPNEFTFGKDSGHSPGDMVDWYEKGGWHDLQNKSSKTKPLTEKQASTALSDLKQKAEGPNDGDRNAKGLVFRNGRWHNDDPELYSEHIGGNGNDDHRYFLRKLAGDNANVSIHSLVRQLTQVDRDLNSIKLRTPPENRLLRDMQRVGRHAKDVLKMAKETNNDDVLKKIKGETLFDLLAEIDRREGDPAYRSGPYAYQPNSELYEQFAGYQKEFDKIKKQLIADSKKKTAIDKPGKGDSPAPVGKDAAKPEKQADSTDESKQPHFGEIAITKDGKMGRLRSSGGMGSNRRRLIGENGEFTWVNVQDLRKATPEEIGDKVFPNQVNNGRPKDGDRNAEGLVFRNGRWHRDDPEEAKEKKPAKKAGKSSYSKLPSELLATMIAEGNREKIIGAKTMQLGGIVEKFASMFPKAKRDDIRNALTEMRKEAGVEETERDAKQLAVAINSKTPTVDEVEHALKHVHSKGGGWNYVDPDTGQEKQYGWYDSKNKAVNAFINAERGKMDKNHTRVNGRYQSWLKSHGTTENKLLGVDTKAKKKAAEDAIGGASMSMDDFTQFMRKVDAGKVTAKELQEAHKQFEDSKEGIRAELSKMKKADILAYTHEEGMRRVSFNDGTKAKAIESTLRQMEREFDKGNSSGGGAISVFELGKKQKPMSERVAAVTDEHLKQHAEEYAERKAQREKKSEARKAEFDNPQTAEQWRRKAEFVGFSKLSKDEQAKHDDAVAADRRERNPSKPKPEPVIKGLEGGAETSGATDIVEGFHQKRQKPTYTVKIENHLGDRFKEMLSASKKLGGSYVNARTAKAYNATAGFQFFDADDAKEFQKILGGESIDLTDKVNEKLAARLAEKQERQTETLIERADRIEERNNDKLNTKRKDNTARRARIARGMESDARKGIAMAKTMRRVADHISSGDAKHLHGVTAASHVDQLDSMLNGAKYARDRKERKEIDKLSFNEREARWEREPGADDIAHAEYPFPRLWDGELSSASEALAEIPGLKMFAKRVGKWASEARREDKAHVVQNHKDIQELERALPRMRRHRDAKVRNLASTFAARMDSFNRLRRMDIKTTPELRAALREYHGLKVAPKGPDPIAEKLRDLKRDKTKGFFPTPSAVVDKILDHAGIEPGHKVLEPSAGVGHIMDAVQKSHPEADLHGIEQKFDFADVLNMKGHKHERGDFLQHDKKYDRIVMNPPFEKRQDEKHVQHAYKLLEPGGRMVAVMGRGAWTNDRSAKFRDWASTVGAKSYELPEGSFNADDALKNTGVNTNIVIIDKPLTEKQQYEAMQNRPAIEVYQPVSLHDSIVEYYRAKADESKGGERKIVTGEEGDTGYFVTIDDNPVFIEVKGAKPGTVVRGPRSMKGKHVKSVAGKRSRRQRVQPSNGLKPSPGQLGIDGKTLRPIDREQQKQNSLDLDAKQNDEPAFKPFKPRSQFDKAIAETVGNNPDDVKYFKDLVNDAHAMLGSEASEHNESLRELLANFGYTGKKTGQIISAARRAADYDAIPGFDEMTQVAENEYPHLLFASTGSWAGQGDNEQALLNTLIQGFKPSPTKKSDEVFELAHSMFKTGDKPDDFDDDFDPFWTEGEADTSFDPSSFGSAPANDLDAVPFSALGHWGTMLEI